MKISSNIISPVKYKTVTLKDKKTGKDISFEMKSDEIQKIEKKVSNLENYLQTMFEQYQKSGTVDTNGDGYLDAKELITSKRFVKVNVDNNENINFSISSLQDIVKDDKKAMQMMEYILKDEGYSNGKISVQKDFLEYLSLDKNLDAVISDKEIFQDIDTKSLSATFRNFLIEQILAMIEKNKDKVFSNITQEVFDSSTELGKQSKVLNNLLKNHENINSLSDEKSIFSSSKKNNTINLHDRKEKLKKYIDIKKTIQIYNEKQDIQMVGRYYETKG